MGFSVTTEGIPEGFQRRPSPPAADGPSESTPSAGPASPESTTDSDSEDESPEPEPAPVRPMFYEQDEARGPECLTLPAREFNIADKILALLEQVQRELDVQLWVKQTVGATAARILHVYDPKTRDFNFQAVIGDGNQHRQSDYCWQKPGIAGPQLLAVEVKAPCKYPQLSFTRSFPI